MSTKVCDVYSTSEYTMFKKLHGNREILESRKRLLMNSIKEHGWIRNPIVVNENMEVIDGQGRLEALSELGLPVEYVIAEGATIQDCISLNIKQANWRSEDYVKCYADMGYEDYILLHSLYGKYPYLPNICINTLAGPYVADGSSDGAALKEGRFIIPDKEKVYDICSFANDCLSIIGGGNGRMRNWAAVLKMVFWCDKIPNDIFLDRLEKNRMFITPCVNIKQVLECLEKVYNYQSRKNKVYFVPEWDYFKTKKGNN